MHPAFVRNSEGALYSLSHGMTLIAMAMDKNEWEAIIEGTMDDMACQKLFGNLQKCAMAKAYQLEIENEIQIAGSKCKSKPPDSPSLGTHFRAIRG
jgi:hypothetical protein